VLLDLLARNNASGTFFVLGWVGQHHRALVRRIADAGHEIASHGFWHERVTTLDPEAFREDVCTSKRVLEDLISAPVIGYRAPNFSIVPGLEWAFDVLAEEGYRYDSSLFPVRRRGYGYPNSGSAPHVRQVSGGTLAEFPLATTSILGYPVPAAGGGYLRHFPLAVVQRAFREATSRAEPATFYIHPCELVPEQPRLPVSILYRVRHFRGLGDTLNRIDKLLHEFRFDTLDSYLPVLDRQLSTHSLDNA
jgi:polysaccharide deacetylase family protein (PEP-CTERM system associated)